MRGSKGKLDMLRNGFGVQPLSTKLRGPPIRDSKSILPLVADLNHHFKHEAEQCYESSMGTACI